MKKYKIKEIFGPTIQGEGSTAGQVVMFLRFAGCNKWSGLERDRENVVCKFCDTDFRGGDSLTAKEIVQKLKEISDVKILIVTGGEPTLQLDKELLSELTQNDYSIYLETNGSKALGELRLFIKHVTVSPKQNRELTKLEEADDIKILYPPIAESITTKEFESFNVRNKYLQTVWDDSYKHNLNDALNHLYKNPNWKLSVQMHKIIGVK